MVARAGAVGGLGKGHATLPRRADLARTVREGPGRSRTGVSLAWWASLVPGERLAATPVWDAKLGAPPHPAGQSALPPWAGRRPAFRRGAHEDLLRRDGDEATRPLAGVSANEVWLERTSRRWTSRTRGCTQHASDRDSRLEGRSAGIAALLPRKPWSGWPDSNRRPLDPKRDPCSSGSFGPVANRASLTRKVWRPWREGPS